jgi:hypothetical protein
MHAESPLGDGWLQVKAVPFARGKAGVEFEVGGFGSHHGRFYRWEGQ